jgi:hypothetical protein
MEIEVAGGPNEINTSAMIGITETVPQTPLTQLNKAATPRLLNGVETQGTESFSRHIPAVGFIPPTPSERTKLNGSDAEVCF